MIEINDFETWPSDVKGYLDDHENFLRRLCSKDLSYRESEALAPQYDQIVRGLKPLLASYEIHGYHCTRLTKNEIDIIFKQGMKLPNSSLLMSRINRLITDKVLSENDGKQLLANNKADDPYRKDMLWFCLFTPFIAGESGIGELLRYWGGEALYHGQELNLRTVLEKIGIPCIVEASLPVKGFEFMESNFVNKYKHHLGIEDHSEDYEGSLSIPISASNVLNVFSFPSDEFVALSGCNDWDLQLTDLNHYDST